MANTNLDRKKVYYKRVIEEGINSPHSEKYKNVCVALDNLVKISDKLKNPKHKMSQAEYEALMKGYEDAKGACESYFAEQNTFNDYEKERKGIIENISYVLNKDLNVLSSCDLSEPISLSEVIEKSRTHVIKLDRADFHEMGGALSNRIPLKTNSGKKGFFTPKKFFDPDTEWKNKLKAYEVKFGRISEECKAKLEALKTDEEFQMKIVEHIPTEKIKENARYFGTVKNHMKKLACLLGMGKDIKEVEQLFKKDSTLYDDLFDFTNSVSKLANYQGILYDTGIKKGANISSRNCAMTDMAKLLGCDHLLANSTKMKVMINGEEVEGVFMETAEGSDLNSLKPGDLVLEAKGMSMENPEALQKMIDLQILDFVCGNTDRHPGNMVYQFEKTMFGGVKFTGIKGIDNDCAFGTLKIVPEKSNMHLTSLNNMKYITPKMKVRLDNLTPAEVKLQLANDDLSEDEINAAMDRVQMIQDAIREKKIKVIDKKHWQNKQLYRHDDKNNYVHQLIKMQNSCENEVFKDKEFKNPIKYAQEIYNSTQVMMEDYDKILEFRKMMDDSKSRIFDSSEYKLMKKYFEKIEKISKHIKENYTNLKNVPDKTNDELRNAYVELANKTHKYTELKKLVPYQVRGQKRLDFATKLHEYACEKLEKLQLSYDKDTKMEAEEPEMDSGL